jgi:hypothetical protein
LDELRSERDRATPYLTHPIEIISLFSSETCYCRRWSLDSQGLPSESSDQRWRCTFCRRGPHEWLVITRRPLADERMLEPQASRDATDQDARYCYRYYLTPTCGAEAELKEPSQAELARVIKAGTCIEASFQRGKGEVGMDEYQVRTVRRESTI